MADPTEHHDEGTVRVPSHVTALAASTLDQLDPPAWGPAPEDATAVVHRCHALRTVPLADLGVEDLRLLISQDIARPVLVPMALGMLRHEPLLEGDDYPGDLLQAVMRVPDAYWQTHTDQLTLLRESLSRLRRDDPSYPRLGDEEFDRSVARFAPEG